MNIKKIVHFSLGPIVSALLGLISLPFVAWFFPIEDVGRLTMLQVVLSLSVSLFSLAMHQAYVREYYEEIDKPALFKVSVVPGLILFGLVSFFLLIAPFSVSNFLFGVDSYFLTSLLFLSIFSFYFINFFAHLLRMQERGLAFSATQIAPKAFFILMIGLILFLDFDAEFEILMSMNALSIFFSFLIFSWLTRDTWLLSIKKSIDRRLLKKMLKFSLPLVAGGLAYWALTAMDRFFLKALAGLEELGVYALAVSLAASVTVLSTIFSSLWHPVVYKWTKEGVDPNKVQAISEYMLILVSAVWALVGIFSWIIPYFLPSEYSSIEYLIVATVAMPLFYMLSETTVIGLGITRRSSLSALSSIVAFFVNAVLNYLLIPDCGASGAALASVLAFFVFFALRTELSAFAWQSLPRFKIYIVVSLYLLATTIMVVEEANIANLYLIWFFAFSIVCFLFPKRIYKIMNFLKLNIESRL